MRRGGRTNDIDTRRDVEAELQWDPSVDPTDIAVKVKNGVVMLSGYVHDHNQRWEAEAAVKRIAGVIGVANDIEVRLPAADSRPDPEIARDAVQAIRFRLPESGENIKAIVRNGWITLEGEVEWYVNRQAAANAVSTLRGVKGASNALWLKPRVQPSEIKRKIEDAFGRSAQLDADQITAW
jgi:osmotically-inducible protein OsmY